MPNTQQITSPSMAVVTQVLDATTITCALRGRVVEVNIVLDSGSVGVGEAVIIEWLPTSHQWILLSPSEPGPLTPPDVPDIDDGVARVLIPSPVTIPVLSVLPSIDGGVGGDRNITPSVTAIPLSIPTPVLSVPGGGGGGGGGISDPNASFTEPYTSLPPYNTATTDPVFGTEVRRVSNNTGITMPNSTPSIAWGDLTGHDYFKKQNAWNCDDTRLLLTYNKSGGTFREAIVLNASTYLVEKTIPIGGTWDPRWHHSNPSVLRYVQYESPCLIGEFNIVTELSTTLYSFPEYNFMYIGPFEGNFSDDGRYVGLHCQKTNGVWETIVFDMVSGTKIGIAALGNWFATDDGTCMISKLGNYIIVNETNTNNRLYDQNFNFIANLPGSWTHGDMALDAGGNEIFCAVNGDNGRVRSYRLSNQVVTDLTTQGFAENVSGRSGVNGWVWASYPGRHLVTNWPPYVDELLRVKTDGSGDMLRLCHLHASYVSEASQFYEAEPHPIPSRNGARVAFRSLWEATGSPVHAFVVIGPAP